VHDEREKGDWLAEHPERNVTAFVDDRFKVLEAIHTAAPHVRLVALISRNGNLSAMP
jgi:hypothetical protein